MPSALAAFRSCCPRPLGTFNLDNACAMGQRELPEIVCFFRLVFFIPSGVSLYPQALLGAFAQLAAYAFLPKVGLPGVSSAGILLACAASSTLLRLTQLWVLLSTTSITVQVINALAIPLSAMFILSPSPRLLLGFAAGSGAVMVTLVQAEEERKVEDERKAKEAAEEAARQAEADRKAAELGEAVRRVEERERLARGQQEEAERKVREVAELAERKAEAARQAEADRKAAELAETVRQQEERERQAREQQEEAERRVREVAEAERKALEAADEIKRMAEAERRAREAAEAARQQAEVEIRLRKAAEAAAEAERIAREAAEAAKRKVDAERAAREAAEAAAEAYKNSPDYMGSMWRNWMIKEKERAKQKGED